MRENLDELFLETRNYITFLMQKKCVDIDALAFDLGVSKEEFISNFSKRIDDFSFYFQTINLLENWEG